MKENQDMSREIGAGHLTLRFPSLLFLLTGLWQTSVTHDSPPCGSVDWFHHAVLIPLLQTEKLKLKRAELPISDTTLNLESFGVFACLVCGTVSHYVPLVALKVTM